VEEVFGRAGVAVNGDRPWDVRVRDGRFYDRVLSCGSLGFGESYMDGWWECGRLDDCVNRLLRHHANECLMRNLSAMWAICRAQVINLQSKRRAFQVGERHYDLGNELFQAMLDPRMVYSCAYWKDATDLDTAQEAKLDLVCRKLYLRPGMSLLDIGCGWGSLAQFAAERYGVEVTGVTVSKEQAALARERCSGLPVTIELSDYRDIQGRFDRVVSIGMFEHVGRKNYDTYFATVHRVLKPGGLTLLHTIGQNKTSRFRGTDPWIDKYIFPNGQLPSMQEILSASQPYFLLEDCHNIGPDYDTTLMAWHKNFNAHWDRLAHRYDDRFYRMWNYYLLCCAGVFRARRGHVWQLVFAPSGTEGTYSGVR
jgi:cyclopropane-fatty-acyl-phospholipid synthase